MRGEGGRRGYRFTGVGGSGGRRGCEFRGGRKVARNTPAFGRGGGDAESVVFWLVCVVVGVAGGGEGSVGGGGGRAELDESRGGGVARARGTGGQPVGAPVVGGSFL